MDKNIPILRFKGFNEDWEKKELKQIAPNISDGNWIESNHIHSKGEYRIIQTGNLGLGKYLDKASSAKYFHQKDFDEVRGNEIFPGDILISRLAEPAGRTIILPSTGFRMVTAVDVTIIRPESNTFDSTFLMTQLNSSDILKIVNQNVSGTSHRRISRRNLEITILNLPSLKEQIQIGTFFQNLDNLITLNQKKYDKLIILKKAMLAKMFPRNGAVIPEIRFKGFSGDWVEKKLGEISESFSGGTPSVSIKEFYNGKIPFIRSGEINSNSTALFVSEIGLINSSAKIVKKGTILYALYGATSGMVALSKINGAINQAILAILPYKGFDSELIMQWLQREKNKITSTYLQGGQGNLSGGIVKDLIIILPSADEQQKIGSYFKNLDNHIALHKTQLDKLNNIKKACFSKMFVVQD